jgi:NAD(P)-dependent dehydrogenase (short-subunit alcohol dehydrogenase family)
LKKENTLTASLLGEKMEQPGANTPPIKLCSDKFESQVVMVTGAAQGIGEVTARLFAAQGASVVLVDLNKEKLREVATQVESQGAKATCRVCNVGVEAEVDSLINEVVSTLGRIDVLVHLAGIYPFKPLLQYSVEEYHRVMNVNMDSCFFLTRAVLPHMQKAGYGRIVNTASGAMLHPEPGLSVYVAAKSAVAGFTRATAAEAGPGVTANAVCPGLIRTDNTWNSGIALDGSRPLFDKMVGRQCVKRHGLPKDVAHVINFLASPEAEFITGQVLDIGGGATFG